MDITKVRWKKRVSHQEMCFRAGGRRRINLQRKFRMLERRHELARFCVGVGFPYNMGCTDLWRIWLRYKRETDKSYYIGRTSVQDDVAWIFGKDWYVKYRKNRMGSMQLLPSSILLMYGSND